MECTCIIVVFPFIHPFIPQLSIPQLSIHSSIPPFIHPSSIQSFIHPSFHLSIHPSILPFIHPFIHFYTNLNKCTQQSIHTCTCIHVFIHLHMNVHVHVCFFYHQFIHIALGIGYPGIPTPAWVPSHYNYVKYMYMYINLQLWIETEYLCTLSPFSPKLEILHYSIHAFIDYNIS